MDKISAVRDACLEAFEDMQLGPMDAARMWRMGNDISKEWPGTQNEHEYAIREAVSMYITRLI